MPAAEPDPQSRGRTLIWDVPTRLFHWALVALIATSWWSVENGKIELHLWSGYGVLFLILFRVIWGLIGTSTSRFSTFLKGPRSIAAYLRAPKSYEYAGHNPIGAMSVVVMLLTLLAQVLFGLFLVGDDLDEGPLAHLVSYDHSEMAFNYHRYVFNGILGLIALHVIAIAVYTVGLKRNLVGPMIHGRSKTGNTAAPASEVGPIRLLIAILIPLAIVAWVILGAPPLQGPS